MKIHEYQAKEILRRYGVATPRGRVTDSADEARTICEELGGRCVVKAQIHAGGRGKGGGVKLAKSPDEAREARRQDPRHAARHAADRARGAEGAQGPDRGGARHRPASSTSRSRSTAQQRQAGRHGLGRRAAWTSRRSRRQRSRGDPPRGVRSAPRPRCRSRRARSCARLGLKGETARQGGEAGRARWSSAYLETDASLAEINPLMVTGDGRRDGARRQDELRRQRALPPPGHRGDARPRGGEPARGRGRRSSTSTTSSSTATIGCMVNGAGLAMATMDIIKLYGGEPANFLDVGGGATQEAVKNAFRILVSDPVGRGGADQHLRRHRAHRPHRPRRGRRASRSWADVKLPVVVRLEGTNVEEGRRDPARGAVRLHRRRAHGRRGREGGRGAAKGGSVDGDLGRQGHAPPGAGHHRQGGHVPRPRLPRLRHPGGRRRDAGQGRRDGRGHPGVRLGARRRARRPAPTPR